mmetsp:Transcript_87009/g.168516  ORF Transcript_87009/g.168516 Transcript_87009/m.168516 type:complete len:159 (+) Transcript_87009:3414-3890(+)
MAMQAAIKKLDMSSLGERLEGSVEAFANFTNLESANFKGCSKIEGALPANLIKLLSEDKAVFSGCAGKFELPKDLCDSPGAESLIEVDLSSLGKLFIGQVEYLVGLSNLRSLNANNTGLQGTSPSKSFASFPTCATISALTQSSWRIAGVSNWYRRTS